MKEHRGAGTAADGGASGAGTALGTPGKRSLVEQEYGAIQRKPADGAGAGAGTASQVAAEGDGHDHGHERDPEPGGEGGADLDTTRPVGGMVPDEIRTALLAEVRRSPRMQQVLREIEEHGGAAFDIKWSARGGFHSGGVIHIDRQDEMPRWISTMMHELNHLNDHRQGLNPSAATSESREDFVNTKMRNEIRSHAISFVGLLEREGSGADPALPPAGFDEFRAHLREREEAEQVCFSSAAIEAMAEQWVEDKYRNEWTTRNTHENYYDYWGRIWDEAHPGGD